MNFKVIAGGVLVMLVVAGLAWGNYQRQGYPNLPEANNSEPVETEINNWSIEALRKRKYTAQIQFERKVRETDKFVSEVVSYESEGLKLYALKNSPKGSRPANGWPVVVVNHGFIEPEVYSVENSYINTAAYFANAGFVVAKPDYRGHDKSEGEAGGVTSRIEYAVDVLNLVAGIEQLPEVNPDKIFMYGHSMGGDVTMRVIEVCGECVAAATLWAPAVTSWPESQLYFARKNRPERLPTITYEIEQKFREADYEQVGSFYHVDKINVPVNVHHGTKDESVPYSWGWDLKTKFDSAGKKINFYSYQGDNHDLAGNWGVALGRDVELFRSVW